jgi:hypothetical protein
MPTRKQWPLPANGCDYTVRAILTSPWRLASKQIYGLSSFVTSANIAISG